MTGPLGTGRLRVAAIRIRSAGAMQGEGTVILSWMDALPDVGLPHGPRNGLFNPGVGSWCDAARCLRRRSSISLAVPPDQEYCQSAWRLGGSRYGPKLRTSETRIAHSM